MDCGKLCAVFGWILSLLTVIWQFIMAALVLLHVQIYCLQSLRSIRIEYYHKSDFEVTDISKVALNCKLSDASSVGKIIVGYNASLSWITTNNIFLSCKASEDLEKRSLA